MNIDFNNLIMVEVLKELGFGAGIGFLLGFTIKRAFKVLIFFVGLYILSLIWLADNGLITVQWNEMNTFLSRTFESFASFAKTALKALSFLSSFAVGFAVGLKV